MAHASTQQQTLFSLVGGEEAVRGFVTAFYDRVLEDPVLWPFFEDTPMDRLRRMQYEIFAAALDGPVAYSGQTLSHAHYGKGITKEHFGRFVDHLVDTLQDLKLDNRAVTAIVDRMNLYADEITGSGTSGA